jgi:hypothetical protein
MQVIEMMPHGKLPVEKFKEAIKLFWRRRKKKAAAGGTMMMAGIWSKYISHIFRGFEQHKNAIHDMLQAPRNHIQVLE